MADDHVTLSPGARQLMCLNGINTRPTIPCNRDFLYLIKAVSRTSIPGGSGSSICTE